MFSARLKLKFCWWLNQLNQLRLIVYPTIYKVLYIPGGCLGFQPSAVAPENQRLEDEISCGTLPLFRFHVNFPGCKTDVDMNVMCYCDTCTRGHVHMDVSENGGTQQPWVFLPKMIILGCFGDTIIFGNTHIANPVGWNQTVYMFVT